MDGAEGYFVATAESQTDGLPPQWASRLHEKAIGEAKSPSHVRHGICLKPLLRRATTPTKAVTSEADDFD